MKRKQRQRNRLHLVQCIGCGCVCWSVIDQEQDGMLDSNAAYCQRCNMNRWRTTECEPPCVQPDSNNETRNT